MKIRGKKKKKNWNTVWKKNRVGISKKGGKSPGRIDIRTNARTCKQARRHFFFPISTASSGETEFIQISGKWKGVNAIFMNPPSSIEFSPALKPARMFFVTRRCVTTSNLGQEVIHAICLKTRMKCNFYWMLLSIIWCQGGHGCNYDFDCLIGIRLEFSFG